MLTPSERSAQEDFIAKKFVRINDRIRVTPVRLIGPDGGQLGILPIQEALQKAREFELDLVEISPTARPPVCRIMDYGKFKYELAKKDKQAKKKQHAFQLKEMRYRPKIEEHDYQFKTKHVRTFIEAGSKVRAFVMFRGREMTRIEFGRKILERLLKDLEDVAVVDSAPKMEGRTMSMVLGPKAEVVKKVQSAKVSEKPEMVKHEEETEEKS